MSGFLVVKEKAGSKGVECVVSCDVEQDGWWMYAEMMGFRLFELGSSYVGDMAGSYTKEEVDRKSISADNVKGLDQNQRFRAWQMAC